MRRPRLSLTMLRALERAKGAWSPIPFGNVGWTTVLGLEDRGLIQKRLTGRRNNRIWQWRLADGAAPAPLGKGAVYLQRITR